ncbi:MAG: RNA polymerase sigma factor [Terracidiphilus sp.]
MGITPVQSVENAVLPGVEAAMGLDAQLLAELWRECEAGGWGLDQVEFREILISIGTEQNFGLAALEIASQGQQTEFFRGLRLGDLVLARACAKGNERGWERFVALYRQTLLRAAIAITGSETLGSELADQLYAELYGLTERDGKRRCPLESYRGRGSLIGWLRTTLAQRFVDHHRRSHREQPLEEFDAPALEPEKPAGEIWALGKAIEEALGRRAAEERLLLAAYYLDGRTLLEIAKVLGVHEATVSRRVRRVTDGLRKQVLRILQDSGLSRRAAEEALGADPRDLDLNLKKLLQYSQTDAFQEKAAS